MFFWCKIEVAKKNQFHWQTTDEFQQLSSQINYLLPIDVFQSLRQHLGMNIASTTSENMTSFFLVKNSSCQEKFGRTAVSLANYR